MLFHCAVDVIVSFMVNQYELHSPSSLQLIASSVEPSQSSPGPTSSSGMGQELPKGRLLPARRHVAGQDSVLETRPPLGFLHGELARFRAYLWNRRWRWHRRQLRRRWFPKKSCHCTFLIKPPNRNRCRQIQVLNLFRQTNPTGQFWCPALPEESNSSHVGSGHSHHR
jgi:hypothetical protein